jgi:hypothetical protein
MCKSIMRKQWIFYMEQFPAVFLPQYSYPNKITCTDLCTKYMLSMHMQIDLYKVHQPDSFNSRYIMFVLKIK